MMVLRVLSLFSGYGGGEFALKRLGVDFVTVGFSDIKKHAIRCYEANHPGVKALGDVTKIDASSLEDFDLLFAGFPCQAFSMAGKRKGFDDTRGTLFRDIIRIVEVKKPKFMLLENVAGLVSHDGGNTLSVILREIRRVGYGVVYKVLNSKDYGVPQNRERIWLVCKLGGWDFMEFQFPEKRGLIKTLPMLFDNSVNYKKVKKTPSRDVMRLKCANITNSDFSYCLCSKQDRYPNSGIIDFEDYYRFLTPRECFRLMGFFDDEIDISMLSIIESYDLSGNGWDVNLASLILKNMRGGEGF